LKKNRKLDWGQVSKYRGTGENKEKKNFQKGGGEGRYFTPKDGSRQRDEKSKIGRKKTDNIRNPKEKRRELFRA